jgi:DNA mismatch repair ATPase MutS
VIRTLVNQHAVGMVTTHDLALTRIVDSMEGRAVNMHFEDTIVDGHMSFDYQLKPGIVTRSNALHLMRLMGLDV